MTEDPLRGRWPQCRRTAEGNADVERKDLISNDKSRREGFDPCGGFSIFTETQAGMSYRPRDEGVYLCLRLAFYVPFPLMGKEPKDQGRLHRTSPRLSKRLTLRSRSTFCEGKRQAPLREGQTFSHPLRALPRPAAGPAHPPRSGFIVPVHGVRCYRFHS